MFLQSKPVRERLIALERELDDRLHLARRRKRWDELEQLLLLRRRVRRAVLLHEEFLGGPFETTPLTVRTLLDHLS
ncbi:MAG: hypothetical protein K6U89_06185 [Chloroflexi bacterium]|nr:hypothetical protein [Chloroflexota bacterium]GIW11817.1 MAG: hypothetical protein KatS3mg061_2874 [Dehalococcoidia bacterium]